MNEDTEEPTADVIERLSAENLELKQRLRDQHARQAVTQALSQPEHARPNCCSRPPRASCASRTTARLRTEQPSSSDSGPSFRSSSRPPARVSTARPGWGNARD